MNTEKYFCIRCGQESNWKSGMVYGDKGVTETRCWSCGLTMATYDFDAMTIWGDNGTLKFVVPEGALLIMQSKPI